MAIFDEKIEIRERCKGVHCVDLSESFPTSIYLQNVASIQTRTSSPKFAEASKRYPPPVIHLALWTSFRLPASRVPRSLTRNSVTIGGNQSKASELLCSGTLRKWSKRSSCLDGLSREQVASAALEFGRTILATWKQLGFIQNWKRLVDKK